MHYKIFMIPTELLQVLDANAAGCGVLVPDQSACYAFGACPQKPTKLQNLLRLLSSQGGMQFGLCGDIALHNRFCRYCLQYNY
jgi:hypothetical protein